jgi:hypothetical protein
MGRETLDQYTSSCMLCTCGPFSLQPPGMLDRAQGASCDHVTHRPPLQSWEFVS